MFRQVRCLCHRVLAAFRAISLRFLAESPSARRGSDKSVGTAAPNLTSVGFEDIQQPQFCQDTIKCSSVGTRVRVG